MGDSRMIEFRKVKKSFKSTEVLHELSFTIQQGEFVVFVGPSGCGKTTTLKMMNRLINPTEGEIYIQGKSILKEDIIRLRRNMGYIIQQVGLFPHMSVKENIQLIGKLERINQKELDKKTQELMEMMGMDYDEYKDRFPAELSGGQQQRVGIARGLVLDPDVILMDEPFSALDPLTRTSLQDQLLDIQSELHKTIVFVTHDMDEAIKIADRICIMHDGQIVQFDTPEEILKNPANEFVTTFVGKNRIWDSPQLIRARDIMIRKVVSASSHISIVRGFDMMRSSKVDSIVIVDRQHHLLGIVTAEMISMEKDRNKCMKDLMIPPSLIIMEDESLPQILEHVGEGNFYHAPVVNEENIVCGLITRSSLMTTFTEQFKRTAGDLA